LDIEQRLHDAVQKFWDGRGENLEKQTQRGITDAGTRGAVTAGTQMRALESLIAEVVCDAGLKKLDIQSRAAVELPGYFRPEKKWDLVVVSEKQLVLAMEFKSMVGSFGKNLNNRSEEAIGSANCLWTAYREGRLGSGPAPFLGYFFLLEDHAEVHGAKNTRSGTSKSIRSSKPPDNRIVEPKSAFPTANDLKSSAVAWSSNGSTRPLA
jgi:hypothetical protein